MSLNFRFSDSEEMYREQIRRFAKTELAPMRQRWDQKRERPQEMVTKALDAGHAKDERHEDLVKFVKSCLVLGLQFQIGVKFSSTTKY